MVSYLWNGSPLLSQGDFSYHLSSLIIYFLFFLYVFLIYSDFSCIVLFFAVYYFWRFSHIFSFQIFIFHCIIFQIISRLYLHYSSPLIAYYLSYFLFYFWSLNPCTFQIYIHIFFLPMSFPSSQCSPSPSLSFFLSLQIPSPSALPLLCSISRYLLVLSFLSFLLLFSHFLFYTILLPFHFPLVLLAPLSDCFSFFLTQIFRYKYPCALRIRAFLPSPGLLLLLLHHLVLPVLVLFYTPLFFPTRSIVSARLSPFP